jgi:hypothetical protein
MWHNTCNLITPERIKAKEYDMNYEKMTIKVQEYLNSAMNTARERKSPEINELHFIANVLNDENIITTLIKRAGLSCQWCLPKLRPN